MNRIKLALACSTLALGLNAQATTVALVANNGWMPFDIDVISSGSPAWIDVAYDGDFSPLSFSFTIAPGDVGTLTVVDGGFAGDRFDLTVGGVVAASTGATSDNFPTNVGLDFDAALADANYSRSVLRFDAGSYTVSGLLRRSALDDTGTPLDATVGGISLSVTAVPEPVTAVSLLAGLGLLTLRLRRA